MTGKSKKDLQTENTKLKEELSDLNLKHESLLKNFETIQKNCESRKKTFKCSTCDNIFESMVDFKALREKHGKTNKVLQCDVCGKVVNEEWKMSAHRKIHENFECTVCGKSFKYLEMKNKHTKIAHENLQIFCHFFNNKKLCPFSKDCIFLHDDAPNCKYGSKCERILCMFKHDDVDDENKDEHANLEDENLDEPANMENEKLDEHENIAKINVNDDELIGIDNPGELRNEENDLIDIVNDVEIASETNDQAIEVIVIVETGSDDEPSKTMKNCEIINIEIGSEVEKVKVFNV